MWPPSENGWAANPMPPAAATGRVSSRCHRPRWSISPFEPEGEQVPATRRDLTADQQQDAVVPALPPLPAGFERVVTGEQQRAGTGGASVRQHSSTVA